MVSLSLARDQLYRTRAWIRSYGYVCSHPPTVYTCMLPIGMQHDGRERSWLWALDMKAVKYFFLK